MFNESEDFRFVFQYKPEWIDSAYKIGKYLYDCGRYESSISYLYFCLVVMQQTDKVTSESSLDTVTVPYIKFALFYRTTLTYCGVCWLERFLLSIGSLLWNI